MYRLRLKIWVDKSMNRSINRGGLEQVSLGFDRRCFVNQTLYCVEVGREICQPPLLDQCVVQARMTAKICNDTYTSSDNLDVEFNCLIL